MGAQINLHCDIVVRKGHNKLVNIRQCALSQWVVQGMKLVLFLGREAEPVAFGTKKLHVMIEMVAGDGDDALECDFAVCGADGCFGA